MNLSQVKKLKHGDEIVCSGYLPKITHGKKYKIRKSETGDIYFTDDLGIGRLLTTDLPLEIYFDLNETEQANSADQKGPCPKCGHNGTPGKFYKCYCEDSKLADD